MSTSHARTQIGCHPPHRDPALARRCKRSWYANLRANPQLTLHVKSGAEGEVEVTAPPITDTGERRARIASPDELDAWIEGSPLVELTEV